MPYLDEARKDFVDYNPGKTHEPGDWNYLFTLAILRVWELTPKYKTIHLLRKACYYEPQSVAHIYAIEQRLLNINVDRLDIKVSSELAFNEFMRRIGNKYEDKKIKENGDVYPDEYAVYDEPIKKTKKGKK